jgi:hypothetical protein
MLMSAVALADDGGGTIGSGTRSSDQTMGSGGYTQIYGSGTRTEASSPMIGTGARAQEGGLIGSGTITDPGDGDGTSDVTGQVAGSGNRSSQIIGSGARTNDGSGMIGSGTITDPGDGTSSANNEGPGMMGGGGFTSDNGGFLGSGNSVIERIVDTDTGRFHVWIMTTSDGAWTAFAVRE